MSTLSNYEGLLALSTSPHLSQAMRGYLVDVLAEHREMRRGLQLIIGIASNGGLTASERKGRLAAATIAEAILAKVAA